MLLIQIDERWGSKADSGIVPELRLWASVLSQAYQDVAFPSLYGTLASKDKRALQVSLDRIRAHAIEWFLSDREDCPSLLWICTALDLDPEVMREPIFDIPKLKMRLAPNRREN